MCVYKLSVIDSNTWYHISVLYKVLILGILDMILILDRNTWYVQYECVKSVGLR